MTDTPDRAVDALLSALSHEIRNELAAVRLRAHLLDEGLGTRDLAQAGIDIDRAAARANELLALVGPLASLTGAPGCDAASLLDAVAQAAGDSGRLGVCVDVGVEPGLPRIAANGNVLHSLLSLLLWASIERAPATGRVRLEALAADGGVQLVVRDYEPADDDLEPDPTQAPSGRALVCAVARQLLEPTGGSVAIESAAEGTRIALCLPGQ
jgi:signal transduction histidine kinase